MTLEEIAELRRLVAADPRADEKWMAGMAGHCNLVAFGGDDVSPVGIIGGEAQLALIVALRNAAPALLDLAEKALQAGPVETKS